MYRGPSRYFKVVRSRDNRYAIWHAEARLEPRWKETGRYGSEDDCWDYIEDIEDQKGYLFNFQLGA